MMQLQLDRLASPIGDILLVHDSDACLRALDFDGYEERMHRLLRTHYGGVCLARAKAPRRSVEALCNYFEGDFSALDAVPVLTGGTTFQREVWAALRQIPPGETTTYGKLAGRIGRPRAVRAVGRANGANPVAILVPCHRVIGASGDLTGFGGGLPRKRWLLVHEGVSTRPQARCG